MQKLINFVTRLSHGRWQIVPTQKVDSLQSEIDRLERHLDHTLARRKPVKTSTQELQKYLDLAG